MIKNMIIILFTLSLMVNGLVTRFVVQSGLRSHQVLFLSGLGSLMCICIFSWWRGQSLFPKNPSKQLLRAILAGGALYLITESYGHLSATSVSLICRTDLALLIALGPLIKVPSSRWQRVGAASLIFLTFSFLGLTLDGDAVWYGLILAFAGTVAITLGYLFIKSSMAEENESVSILTPSLAVMAYGVAGAFVTGNGLPPLQRPELCLLGLFLGLIMFLLYRLTMKMYNLFNLATAEYPTLIATGVMLPFEMYLFRTSFGVNYVLIILAFIVLAGVTIKYFPKLEEA